MVAVALIVLLLALLVTIGMIAGAGESLTLELLGSRVSTTGTGLYVAGLVIGLASLAALWLLRVGLRKGWRQHQRIKDLERRAGASTGSFEHPHPSPSSISPSEDDSRPPSDASRSPSDASRSPSDDADPQDTRPDADQKAPDRN